MTLCAAELMTVLGQKITVGQDDIQLHAIRAHLLRFRSPTGSVRIRLLDSNSNPIAISDTVDIASVGSNTFWHGYIRFLFTAQLKAGRSYVVQLESLNGYSFSESAYMAWCNDFDLRKVSANYTPSTGINAPLDMEIWEDVNFWRRVG